MAGRPRARARLAALQAQQSISAPEVPAPAPTAAVAQPAPAAPVRPERAAPPARDSGSEQGPGLTVLAAGYRSAFEDAAAADTGQGASDGSTALAEQKFQRLLGLSFDFAEEVMALVLDPADKNFAKVLATKQAVASSILTATARVRAGDLRPKNEDGISAFLQRLKAGEPEPPLEESLFH